MNAWKHSTPAGIAGTKRGAAWRRIVRVTAVGLAAFAGPSQATEIIHNASLYFCTMTGVVHSVCRDEIRDGSLVAGLDLDCKLTREAPGGTAIAVAQNQQRVSAENDSIEITRFDIPVAPSTRFCTINRGKYLQWSVLGPVRISIPPQPTAQSCATYNGGTVF